MLLTVSVVSHADSTVLQDLLRSLAQYESSLTIQLLITDNLGHDLPDIQPVGWHSVVTHHNPRPRGFAANHNAAFQLATGEYFCVLNPDVMFIEPVLHRLIEQLERHQCHIAAPLILDSRGRIQESFRRLPSPWEVVRRRMGSATWSPAIEPGDVIHPDWIAGMFMLMRSADFSALGGLDARYQLYFEDVDLCTRARLAGMKMLVDTGIRMLHDPRRESRRPGRHLMWHMQSATRFFLSDVYRRARRLG